MNWKELFVRNSNPAKSSTPPKEVTIVAPFSGTVVSLDDVPDEMFAKRMIGDGVAIAPDVSGTAGTNITSISVLDIPYSIFTTYHAYFYEGPDDLEIIVHIGINTVSLKKEGFKLLVKEIEGTVPVGTALLEFDPKLITSKKYSLLSPIIASATKSKLEFEIIPKVGSQIKQGEAFLRIRYS